jgi:hypothetical protein
MQPPLVFFKPGFRVRSSDVKPGDAAMMLLISVPGTLTPTRLFCFSLMLVMNSAPFVCVQVTSAFVVPSQVQGVSRLFLQCAQEAPPVLSKKFCHACSWVGSMVWAIETAEIAAESSAKMFKSFILLNWCQFKIYRLRFRIDCERDAFPSVVAALLALMLNNWSNFDVP